MRTAAHLLHELESERGSVLMEFCLMLPIWLLMFGGTFMLFDVTMARLHLQEANRNLTWLQNDRYDSQGLINKAVYSSAVRYFEARNELEESMSGGPMWGFGDDYTTYSAKSGDKKSGSPQFWGSTPDSIEENGVELAVNNSVTEGLSSLSGGLLSDKLENGFMDLHTGNMELEMKKVSAVYIGAVGLSSVLFPGESGDGTVPLYKSKLTFTRGRETSKNGEKRKEVNAETLLMRRKDMDRDKVKTINDLFTENIINRSWPSNGSLGDIKTLLGI